MKSCFVAISILSSGIFSFGQTDFSAGISLVYMNVIYTTIDNPITINVNAPFSDIECSIDNKGILEKERLNSYRIRVAEEGYYQFKITQKSTGASVSYSLRAKKLPIPFANLNSVFGDSITLQQLALAQQLDLSYVPGFDINISAKVVNFSLLKISKINVRSESNNPGSIFSNETKNIISACNSGDILIFKNIVANGADPGTLKIPDLVLYVK